MLARFRGIGVLHRGTKLWELEGPAGGVDGSAGGVDGSAGGVYRSSSSFLRISSVLGNNGGATLTEKIVIDITEVPKGCL